MHIAWVSHWLITGEVGNSKFISDMSNIIWEENPALLLESLMVILLYEALLSHVSIIVFKVSPNKSQLVSYPVTIGLMFLDVLQAVLPAAST